jgi:hypothetical protein
MSLLRSYCPRATFQCTSSTASVPECGGELNAANAIAAAGPGAKPGPGTAVIGAYITG